MSRVHQEASLSDDVYYQLKDYILSDIIHPPERLQIAQLSQHFGVSITPIREALIRLSAEELVELRPGRGFFHKEFIPGEQIALHDALHCLLKHAIERGGVRPQSAFSRELKLAPAPDLGAPRPDADIRADVIAIERLLERIALSRGNTQIAALVRGLCERTRISRLISLEMPATATIIHEGARQCADALDRGDSHAAIAVLREQMNHLRQRMPDLAGERRRRLYEAFPLTQPGAGRHIAVRYRDEGGGAH